MRDAPLGEVPGVVPSPPGAISAPQFPPDLARVVAAWDRLPPAIKAGVLALMRTVAAEELGRVRANALAPTQIRTAENVAGMGENAAYVEREDVAEAVLYLCSDASRNVTGQAIKLQ